MSLLNLRTVKLGDNSDLTKNFVIEVPAVADGTLVIKRESGAVVASIDATGKVVFPGNVVPAFSAYNSVATSIAANGIWTYVDFQTEEFDLVGSYNPSTSEFVPTVAGYYQITAAVLFSATSPAGGVALYKNGVVVKGAYTSNVGGVSAFVTALVYMNGTTDKLAVKAMQNATSAVLTSVGAANTYFSGFLARAA